MMKNVPWGKKLNGKKQHKAKKGPRVFKNVDEVVHTDSTTPAGFLVNINGIYFCVYIFPNTSFKRRKKKCVFIKNRTTHLL